MTSVKFEISWPRGTNRKLGHRRKRVAIPVVDRIMRAARNNRDQVDGGGPAKSAERDLISRES